ncbi:hypothetical protein CG723_06560 [Streptomyces sp. CB01635]|uniref:hypothetical protein n=1 Tax=unclassified Streptomyces TaxID=2593676 RepID=UPI000C27B202|nr:hypothetical protein [Streptomyces sp. CB01635]PJN12680.1 hypothetical protein CG723_06560 [Streptomyces sp. CB01635]
MVATGLWAEFLPDESRREVAAAPGALPAPELDALAREVDKQDLWDLVLPLVELMDDAGKERILELPALREQAQ